MDFELNELENKMHFLNAFCVENDLAYTQDYIPENLMYRILVRNLNTKKGITIFADPNTFDLNVVIRTIANELLKGETK